MIGRLAICVSHSWTVVPNKVASECKYFLPQQIKLSEANCDSCNGHIKNKQNLDKYLQSSTFCVSQTADLVSSPLGCKLLRKRPHSCSASQRQPVLRLPLRATGSQLSLRVITYKLLAVEWRVKYGHRPYNVSTRQQVNWPRRPLKIWAYNISSDWICIKAPLFRPPHHLFVLKHKSGAFSSMLDRVLSRF